jgi:hypothetical protein
MTRTFANASATVSREDGWRTVLRKDKVEIGDSGENDRAGNPDKRPWDDLRELADCVAVTELASLIGVIVSHVIVLFGSI